MIAFSAILVDLADVAPATAAFWRCAYALPLLGVLAWPRGPALRPPHVAGAPTGVRRRRAVRDRHGRLALRDPRRRRRPGHGARQLAGRDRAVRRAGRARRAGAAGDPVRAAAGVQTAVLLGVRGARRTARTARTPAGACSSASPPGLAYSAFLLVQRQGSKDLRRLGGALFDMSVVAAVCALAFGLAIGVDDLAPAWPSAFWLVTLAVTSQVLGWLLITVSLPRLPAAMTSMILTIQPIASVALGAILLGQEPIRAAARRRSLDPHGPGLRRRASPVSLRERLAEGRTVRLDGGLSTALEAARRRHRDAAWTARVLRDQPELVLAAHRAFVDAGAEIVISASYQAPHELLRRSVQIARQAGVLVAASVAPYGAVLAGGQEYTGDYEVPIRGGTSGACGNCWTPTASRSRRSRGSMRLCRSCGLWRSWTGLMPGCRSRAGTARLTGHGEPIEDAVLAVVSSDRVVAVGVNCTGAGVCRRAAGERIAAVSDLPLVAYPNAGRSYDAVTKTWSGEMSSCTFEGATLVGGCCGWGPAMPSIVCRRGPRVFGAVCGRAPNCKHRRRRSASGALPLAGNRSFACADRVNDSYERGSVAACKAGPRSAVRRPCLGRPLIEPDRVLGRWCMVAVELA